jgi:hypothetical protein
METVAVIILNYKRHVNIRDIILPSLLNNPLVSTIIIAHGLRETVFGVDNRLEDEEIVRDGKVLHIGDFKANELVCCWRRWKLIKELKDKGILTEQYIHSQDDDLMFNGDYIPLLIQEYKKGRGILLSGSPCRNVANREYSFKDITGPCNIVIGRSIFTKIEIICKAVEKADQLKIPSEIIKFCDDICLSFLCLDHISDYMLMKNCSIPCVFRDLASNDALSARPDWIIIRNKAVAYMMTLNI